jgi:hypothetical protein
MATQPAAVAAQVHPDDVWLAEIGFSKAAARHGLAADEHVPHGAIMALGTESRSEIDVRTTFGRLFGAGVDLGDMRGGIDGRPR